MKTMKPSPLNVHLPTGDETKSGTTGTLAIGQASRPPMTYPLDRVNIRRYRVLYIVAMCRHNTRHYWRLCHSRRG
jgi:hypothetical protein